MVGGLEGGDDSVLEGVDVGFHPFAHGAGVEGWLGRHCSCSGGGIGMGLGEKDEILVMRSRLNTHTPFKPGLVD